MARNYDETYLDGLIAKAKKSWEGVDVESYMSDLRDDTDKEDAVLPKEIASYIAEQAKYNRLKIIEERAEQYATRPLIPDSTIPAYIAYAQRNAYIAGAKDQQYIDRLLIEQLIDKACNIFCHTGCPHKTDSYNCLNDKCDTWKVFKRMMEEEK